MAAFFKSLAPPGAYGPSERRPVLKLDWRLGADGRPIGRWHLAS